MYTCIVSTSASDQHSAHFIESPDIRIKTPLGDFPINNEQVDLYKLHVCETAIRIVALFETAVFNHRYVKSAEYGIYAKFAFAEIVWKCSSCAVKNMCA